MSGALGSLKEVLERNKGVNDWPELLCFGLLEAFDISKSQPLSRPVILSCANQVIAPSRSWAICYRGSL